MSRRKKAVVSLCFFVITLILVLHLVTSLTYKRGLAELQIQGNIRLELYVNYLEGILEKYESLPELLAIDDTLVRALLSPHEKQRIETLNRYLETINRVSNTSDTYLMNKDGLTIAASNWQTERPFIGRNFSFRPYFKEAMKGNLGRYFALGATSAKRGYFFAYPVRREDEILGAVTVKINIDSVEQKWAYRDENFLVTDPDGVIFITTKADWRYKTLKPLDNEVLLRIVESRRYPEAELEPLSETSTALGERVHILTISDGPDGEPARVLKQAQFMPQAGWHVHILSDTKVLRQKVLFVNILVASFLGLAYIMVLLLFQRQHRLAEIKIIEEEAKRSLEKANELLETRVRDRTQKLTEANALLQKEVIDRKQAEIKLKRTRKELVHAAKLAVLGQMSAGINHELNQPLAAIRSYTDNCKQLLEKGRSDDARWNLEQIGELTERMAQIGAQLKLFSRKTSGQIVAVPLHGVIDGALEILNPVLKKSGVELQILLDSDDFKVKGNHVLLQQVLVNLISNGVQAMENQEEKRISVECREENDRVLIAVADNGPGVSRLHRGDIFEPFYTTKKSGQGLGLGLTISARIVKELGGKIGLVQSEKGARFEFSLEKTA